MTHIHKLKSTDAVLKEKRIDPITGDSFNEGDEIVVCAVCKSAFLYSSWCYLNKKHCNQSETLQVLQESKSLQIQFRTEPVIESWKISQRKYIPYLRSIIIGFCATVLTTSFVFDFFQSFPQLAILFPLGFVNLFLRDLYRISSDVIFQRHSNSLSIKGKRPFSIASIESITVRITTDDPYFNTLEREDMDEITKTLSRIEFAVFLKEGKSYEFHTEFLSDSRVKFYTFLQEISKDIPIEIQTSGIDLRYLSKFRSQNFRLSRINHISKSHYRRLKVRY